MNRSGSRQKNNFNKFALITLILVIAYFVVSHFMKPATVQIKDIETLPLPSALVPPPSSFVMAVEPNPDIPGIRRLKVMRPDFMAGDNSQESSTSYYLTGTKSAEIIRKPVSKSIKPFPDVTLAEAVEGALAADEWGFEIVQAYLNKSLGDEAKIEARIEKLLIAIEDKASDYTRLEITEAINLVIEAGVRAYNAAYMVPAVLDRDFKLKEGAIGWDFGPKGKIPYDDFTRVTPDSSMLNGFKMKSHVRNSAVSDASIMDDGIRNIKQFVATGLDNGTYRLLIMTGRLPGNEEIQYPFGVDMKQNGAQMNLIDTRATQRLVPIVRLSTNGPARLSDAASLQTNDMAQEQSGSSFASKGHMIVTRITISNGIMRINFSQFGLADTYVTAVMLYPEEPTEIFEKLQQALQEFFERIQPKGGVGSDATAADIIGTAQQIMNNGVPLVIDPVTANDDAAGGVPTEEAFASTPGGSSTTGANAGSGSGTTVIDDTSGFDLGSQVDNQGDNTETEDSIALISEAGAYDPIPLGEDFTLDGCGSTLGGVSTCSLTSTGSLELVWVMNGEVIGTGDTLVVQTGEGTPFDAEGIYEVTLQAQYNGEAIGPDGVTITLDDGTTIFLPGDLSLVSLDTAIIQIIAPIPEPGAVAMMATVLAFTWLFHQRRRRRYSIISTAKRSSV